MSNKKKELLSTAMKRTSEWIFSLEIPSDFTVKTARTSFSLHKFPLISKCGYIRKLVLKSTDPDISAIEISDVPGGAEAFELAARFCYGINFEITIENIAKLRCVAEFLEMTEDYSGGNLVRRTETYINEIALKSLAGSVSILHSCKDLLPIAEEVKLVSRCIDRIALVACEDCQFSTPVKAESGPIVDWWAEDLTILRIDFFQRALVAMISRGLRQQTVGQVLVLYAQKSLRALEVFGKSIDPRQEHEKRVVLEIIVGLLPREKNTVSISFLSMLLRAAIYLETTVSCRLDLEKRMASQLGQATLADLLIPSYSLNGNTLFDVETVQRIMANFLECEMKVDRGNISPLPSEMERVARLMENYLSEVSSDRNLSVSKFISLAELIPEQARLTEDGMYRAIDIYLKAHPAISDIERKKICSIMDCQKLSREACAHAAQNDRLPVQTVVQVLYYEQQRLREVVDDSLSQSPAPAHKLNWHSINSLSQSPAPAHKLSRHSIDSLSQSLATAPKLNRYSIDVHPLTDEVSTLQRENQDLKLELIKMKMRLKDTENSPDKLPAATSPLASTSKTFVQKHTLPWKSFMVTVSRKLGRFIRAGKSTTQSSIDRNRPSKHRRHSIS